MPLTTKRWLLWSMAIQAVYSDWCYLTDVRAGVAEMRDVACGFWVPFSATKMSPFNG